MKMTKENNQLVELISHLSRDSKPIWVRTAELLSRSRRRRVEVNVSKLDVYGEDGRFVLVPGKVLGSGDMSKKLIVAAFAFSESARKRIEASGGKAISIPELRESHPDGKGVLLLI